MSLRENLSFSLKKGLSLFDRSSPSRAYDSFFEGYQETRVEGKRVRSYVGDHYVRQVSRSSHRRHCILYGAAYAAAAALFVICALHPAAANQRWYVVLPQAAALLTFGWTAFGLFHYCTAPQKMQLRQYRESAPIVRRGAALTSAALGLLTLAYLTAAVLGEEAAVLPAALALPAACAMGAVYQTEKRVPYERTGTPEGTGPDAGLER